MMVTFARQFDHFGRAAMSQSCLCPEVRPAPPASLGRNSRLNIFILDAGMWRVFGNVSQEHRWGSDGASLENASGFSQDPILYRGGINLYAYVRNAPTRRLDPSGLCAKDCTKGAPPTASQYGGINITPPEANPDKMDIIGELFEAAGTLEMIDEFSGLLMGGISSLVAADGADAAGTLVEWLVGKGFAGSSDAKVAVDKLIKALKNNKGYAVYVKVTWKECESCSCWLPWSTPDYEYKEHSCWERCERESATEAGRQVGYWGGNSGSVNYPQFGMNDLDKCRKQALGPQGCRAKVAK